MFVLQKGVVNNATAMVTLVHIDNHGVVTNIGFQLIVTSMHIFLKHHIFQHKYTYEWYYYKASFPIVLACAMTDHKSQCATILTKVIVDIRNEFAPRLTYVHLSRTK